MAEKIFKTLIGLLLVPIAVGAAKAFYSSVSGISVFSGVLNLLERGVLVYLIFHVFFFRPVYLYVLGHECVHVLATWLCGGRVVSFNVTPSGGNVVTSKTNFFIELSPYFVPFYTILLGVIYLVLRTIDQSIPHMSLVFIFLIGVTLTFHFVMTAEALKLQQPDIMKSGLLFSLVIIFVFNLVVVMAVFSPIFSGLSFTSFIRMSWLNSIELYKDVYGKIVEAVNSIRMQYS